MGNTIITKIGDVSAYLDAVEHGFEGTRAEFGELLANSANYAQAAGSAASAASAAAATATTKAMEATTAATAAQTAKTQTEQSASQALTDIGTARTAAISAVQTEGQTQTANARAQAQAAATSATTASTKASEASASATSAGQSATNAAASATNAAQSASDAQDVLDSIPADYSDLSEDVDQLKADLGDKSHLETLDKTNIVSAINSLNRVVRTIAKRTDDRWVTIKEHVKMGFGELLYPVGTEFEVDCPDGAPYSNITFVVVDHRVENDEPIMTLLMKHVIYGIQFDAIQAMICPSEPMPAGTYHFKLLDGYDTAYDGGKYVQFTLANALEAGGQIVINWPYNQTWIGKNATVYHAFGTTAVETCVMSEGTGGTYLGVADGTVSILNYTDRGRYGSNNYAKSAVREWLNSDAQAGAWQTQKTKFQRPCNYNASKAGFVTYLDPGFVAIVRSGSHPNRTNQVFDLNGTEQAYSTTDKFYLLSNEEVGFTSESEIVCGTVLDFYKEAAQEDKIKYDITSQATARTWWLRLPYPSNAITERGVDSSGALNSGTAGGGLGAAAACEI